MLGSHYSGITRKHQLSQEALNCSVSVHREVGLNRSLISFSIGDQQVFHRR